MKQGDVDRSSAVAERDMFAPPSSFAPVEVNAHAVARDERPSPSFQDGGGR